MKEIWRPSVTVAAVIERDGRFLLVEELQDGRRVLNQPAGHLDPGIYRWHYQPADVTFLRFCFSGAVTGIEKSRALDKEIVALHWLTPAELKDKSPMHRSPLVQQCLDDYLAGKNFSLELLSKPYG
jgi:hypothetical protein